MRYEPSQSLEARCGRVDTKSARRKSGTVSPRKKRQPI
jgi:hypothetical protein